MKTHLILFIAISILYNVATPYSSYAFLGQVSKAIIKLFTKETAESVTKKTIIKGIPNLAKELETKVPRPKNIIQRELSKNSLYYNKLGYSELIVNIGLTQEVMGINETDKLLKSIDYDKALFKQIWRSLDDKAIGGNWKSLSKKLEKKNINHGSFTNENSLSKDNYFDKIKYERFNDSKRNLFKDQIYKLGKILIEDKINKEIIDERHEEYIEKKVKQ